MALANRRESLDLRTKWLKLAEKFRRVSRGSKIEFHIVLDVEPAGWFKPASNFEKQESVYPGP